MRSLLLVILLGLASPALAAPQTVAIMDIAPDVFVKTVTSSNTFEIKSSELAAQKSAKPSIKEFAAQMIADHSKAAEDLAKAAGDVPVPTEMSAKHAGMIALLQDANGADFDSLYTDMQAGAHAEAVTLFATFVAGAPASDLKDFAAATLPTLEMHKEHIDKIVAAP